MNNVSDDELVNYILIGQTYVKLRLLHRFVYTINYYFFK